MAGRIRVTYEGELRMLSRIVRFFRRGRRPEAVDGPVPAELAVKGHVERDVRRRRPVRDDALARTDIDAYLEVLTHRLGPLAEATGLLDFVGVRVFVVDASGLAALARGDALARAYLTYASATGASVVVPATLLLDASIRDVANAVATIVGVDATVAVGAGELMARTHLALPSDAIVVAYAASRAERTAIVTADPVALATFVRASERSIAILPTSSLARRGATTDR